MIGFKIRDGVKTCATCGRDEKGYCASSRTTQSMPCIAGDCPWKNKFETPEELAARYAHLNLWSAA